MLFRSAPFSLDSLSSRRRPADARPRRFAAAFFRWEEKRRSEQVRRRPWRLQIRRRRRLTSAIHPTPHSSLAAGRAPHLPSPGSAATAPSPPLSSHHKEKEDTDRASQAAGHGAPITSIRQGGSTKADCCFLPSSGARSSTQAQHPPPPPLVRFCRRCQASALWNTGFIYEA